MTNFTNNNEVVEILEDIEIELDRDTPAGMAIEPKGVKIKLGELLPARTIRQIEDFYRNKILEAVKYGWDASGEGWNAEYTGSSRDNPDKVREDLALVYLNTITAQFNSKGDSDE